MRALQELSFCLNMEMKTVGSVFLKRLNEYALCLFCIVCMCGVELNAQVIDFTDLYAPYVHCYTGHFSNPFEVDHGNHPVPNRHEHVNAAFLDPNTDWRLYVDAGVIKLGNDNAGSEAEAITYTFQVTPNNALLVVKFATVMQNHGHSKGQQAYFQIRVMDTLGNEITADACRKYQIYPEEFLSSHNVQVEQIFESGDESRFFSDWITVPIDLYSLMGQTITIEFSTHDCALNEHFGYAYFAVQSVSSNLTYTYTDSSQIVTAPAGFDSYMWSNGQTTQSATYSMTDTLIYCIINREEDCSIILGASYEISPGGGDGGEDIPTVFIDSIEIICEGEDYYGPFWSPIIDVHENTHLTFPIYTGTHMDTFYDFYIKVAFLYHYVDECVLLSSEGYHEGGFNIDALQPGMMYDTIKGISREGCDSISILRLNVIPPMNSNARIKTNNMTICNGEPQMYWIDGVDENVSYRWLYPDYVVGNVYSPGTRAELLISNGNSDTVVVIQVERTNACGGGIDTLSISIVHYPTYRVVYEDSVAYGHAYHGYGFDIPPWYNVGEWPFDREEHTVHGCDSIIRLRLICYKPLNISVLAYPNSICEGEESVLSAVGEYAALEPVACPACPVNIGDYICADDSIFSPSEIGGRTPVGVVFYVDPSGWHGWAVSTGEIRDTMWGRDGNGISRDIAALTNYTIALEAIRDLNGELNNAAIKQAGVRWEYPAAYLANDDPSWYFPAMGQLCQLLGNSYIVNQSLALMGATTLSGKYWSSTEAEKDMGINMSKAWMMDKETGQISKDAKIKKYKIRTIRDF